MVRFTCCESGNRKDHAMYRSGICAATAALCLSQASCLANPVHTKNKVTDHRVKASPKASPSSNQRSPQRERAAPSKEQPAQKPDLTSAFSGFATPAISGEQPDQPSPSTPSRYQEPAFEWEYVTLYRLYKGSWLPYRMATPKTRQ